LLTYIAENDRLSPKQRTLFAYIGQQWLPNSLEAHRERDKRNGPDDDSPPAEQAVAVATDKPKQPLYDQNGTDECADQPNHDLIHRSGV
jgi:hypothetical protein